MAQQDKPRLFRALREQGVTFEKHYRDYSTEQLQQAWDTLRAQNPALPVTPVEEDQPAQTETVALEKHTPDEMAGVRLNTQLTDQPIRKDEMGRLWYQDEVRKPEYPKPRGRRVLKYLDRGVKTETVQNGEYIETFEVAGVGEARPAEEAAHVADLGHRQDAGREAAGDL